MFFVNMLASCELCLDGSGTLFYTTVTREMSLKCIKHFLERINKGGPRFAEYIGLTLLFFINKSWKDGS